MTDYTVDRLSIERIEGIARDVLADCPKLPNGAIDILATLRLPTVKTILVLPLMIVGWALLLSSASALDGLTLGEDSAQSLGFDLSVLRLFSFIEVLPLVLLIIEAINHYRLIRAHQEFKYRLAYTYVIGAGFWNFVGAGVPRSIRRRLID